MNTPTVHTGPSGLNAIARNSTLAAGPIVTVLATAHLLAGTSLAGYTSLALWVILLLVWSPLFCSIPALMMQDARDQTLSHLGGRGLHPGNLVRGILLIPALLRRGSSVRAETAISLVGWIGAIIVAAPILAAGPAPWQ